MNPDEIDQKIKQALVKMHVYERSHNQVSYIHTKEMIQMIFELCPIDEKDLINMLKISIGMDKRYIRDYLNGFRAWGIIFRENGVLYTEKPIAEQITYSVNDKSEVVKTKICPKNKSKVMDVFCTIDKCKTCEGLL